METVKKIWRDALSVLETEASAISFDVWIRPLEAVDIDGDKLVLVAPTDGNVIAINNQLRPLIGEEDDTLSSMSEMSGFILCRTSHMSGRS